MTTTQARPVSSSLQLAAELGLALLTVVTVLGFGRLFEGGGFLGPMLAAALVAHAIAMLMRRAGRGLLLTGLAFLLGAALLSAWTFYFSTTTLGIPGAATWTALTDDLRASWELFREVVAPAPAHNGLVLISCLAVWVAVYLADWAAFRLWSGVEAVVPAATLFVFASMLGSADYRVGSTGLFLGALLAFILLHRAARQEGSTGWLGGDSRATSTVLAGGAFLGLGAVIVGMVLGPALPGADDEAVVAWRDRDDGGGSRVTLSPMVDIRKRLVDLADVEVFTVESDERAYWRLTSLDTFDGTIWKSRGDYEDVDGELPNEVVSEAPTVEVIQDFEVEALASLWLPAAFQPAAVRSDELDDIVYEASSATLIVGSDLNTSDGLRYEVRSELPLFDPEELAAAEGPVPPDIAERYLALPPDLGPEVEATAEEAVTGAETPYTQALALQDFFQQNFTYDTEVDPGHSSDAIGEFLESRTGYCEQFAGTYAAMARSLGIPARVAVGFTPGEVDPDEPDVFHVKGEHAHAWPEVYLNGQGWVAFEPTPTRGLPGGEAYTGVPEMEQDTVDGAVPVAPPETTPTTTGAPSTTAAPLSDEADPRVTATGGEPEGGDSSWPFRVLAAVGLALVSAGAYAGGVVLLKRARRRARHRSATDPRAEVRALWRDVVDLARIAGVRPRSSETHHEYVQRLRVRLPVEDVVIDRLAWATSAADYSREGPTPGEVQAAHDGVEAIEVALREATTRGERLRAALDPRPLLPRRGGRTVDDRTRVQARPI